MDPNRYGYFDFQSPLADYLDALPTNERVAFGTSPHTEPLRVSTTLAPRTLVYAGPTPTATAAPIAPSTPSSATGAWRRLASTAALTIANQAYNAYRANPTFVAILSPIVTRLRAFGLRVLGDATITETTARAYLAGEAALLASVPAGWTAVVGVRDALTAAREAIPQASGMPGSTSPGTATPFTPSPMPPSGGGWASTPGPSPDASAGGGSSPAPTPGTGSCPSNASPSGSGCACNAGYQPDPSMTFCVPIPATGGGSGGSSSTAPSGSSWFGWVLLLGGAALAYRALGK